MSNQEKANELKAQGNAAFQNKQFDAAIAAFTEAIQLCPDDAVFYSNRSMVYASTGQFEKALEDGKKCIELRPDWPKSYSRTGLALFKLGKFEEAQEVYDEGLQHCPNDSSLQDAKQQAVQGMQQRFMHEMNAIFGPQMWVKLEANPVTRELIKDPLVRGKLELLQKHPDQLSALSSDPKLGQCIAVILGLPAEVFGQAQQQHQQGPPPPRQEAPKPAAEKKAPPPKQELTEEQKKELEGKAASDKLKDEGNQLFKTKDFVGAIAKYDQAIEALSTQPSYYTNKAAACFHLKKFDDCIEVSRQAIEVAQANGDPQSIAKAYSWIGQAHIANEQWDEALEAFDKSLLEDSSSKVRKLQKQVAELKKEQEQKQYVNPEIGAQHKEKADQLFKDGKFGDAIKEYDEALRRDPDNIRILSNRALCFTKLMEWQRGLDDCNRILEFDSSFVKAYIRKSKIQHFLKQYHKALDTIEAGLKLDPNNKELQEMRMQVMISVQRSSTSQQVDEQQVHEAMKDPEIQAILKNPVISQVLNNLQTNPQAAQAAMQDPTILAQIQKLIAAGILRIGGH